MRATEERPLQAASRISDPPSGSRVRLRGLFKRYEGVLAVNDVSLDIAAGEFMTLLGPSGSGKTTTLNMIAGLIDVSDGEIMLDDQPIVDLPPHRRNIGMVFQSYALFPHMTAFENIAFPLRRRKVPGKEIEQRVREMLELVQLRDHGTRYPRQLSGGQQQRVAFARAMIFRPRVLLMDEPLGALDKKLREWLQLEIRRIHHEVGITFIYVTHDQEEALVLSDRIAIFHDGRVEQVGTPSELYERPRTRFVAEFLGDSNIFTGRTESGGTHARLVCDGYAVLLPSGNAKLSGDATTLVVRPERVFVCDADKPVGYGINRLRGIVRQIIYVGNSRKLAVDVAGGSAAIVREQAGTWSRVYEGDIVDIGWAAEDGVIVDSGGL
jgi:putative spermidine/putrescine transport system ATP-binding protein